MNLPKTAKIDKNGSLEIAGIKCSFLAEKFGTPLYVIDEDTIRNNCSEYNKAFAGYKNSLRIFACKSLCVKAILKVIISEGFGLDIASGGELHTALKAGCDPKKIYFHGNNKTAQELSFAVKSGIGCFVIDNFEEISRLSSTCKQQKRNSPVMIRVNPGIEAHTHDFVKTGTVDSKFGIQKNDIVNAVKQIIEKGNLDFVGLHSHIGSQIFDTEPYVAEVEVLFKLAKAIKDVTGIEVQQLNLGGGIGISYTKSDKKPDKSKFVGKIIAAVRAFSKKYSITEPKIIIEPGRSIVAEAGVTLYTVGAVKKIMGIRNYVITDGGMSDNPRYALYQAKYDALLTDNAKGRAVEIVTIAGRACESGDVIIKDIKLPSVKTGDIIAVLATGAYNFSMASNYNRFTRPAMVMLRNKKASLIVKKETYADLIRNDL